MNKYLPNPRKDNFSLACSSPKPSRKKSVPFLIGKAVKSITQLKRRTHPSFHSLDFSRWHSSQETISISQICLSLTERRRRRRLIPSPNMRLLPSPLEEIPIPMAGWVQVCLVVVPPHPLLFPSRAFILFD